MQTPERRALTDATPPREPMGRPQTYGPLQPPLFDDRQIQRFQELYERAPLLYRKSSTRNDERPDFLREDEQRLQRLRLEEERLREGRRSAAERHEEHAALWRLLQETQDENELLKRRIHLLTEEVMTYERMMNEIQFNTRDGSQERAAVPAEAEEVADGGASGLRADGREATTAREPGDSGAPQPTGGGADGAEGVQAKTLQVMLSLMQGMQELQKKVMEVKFSERDEEKAEAEWVRGGALVLPKLAEWSGTTGPIDFNDWLSLIEPQMADLTNTSAEWWAQLLHELEIGTRLTFVFRL